jgi:hypothetical protein
VVLERLAGLAELGGDFRLLRQILPRQPSDLLLELAELAGRIAVAED